MPLSSGSGRWNPRPFNYRGKRWKRLSAQLTKERGKCGVPGCSRTLAQLAALRMRLVPHHRKDPDLYPEDAYDPNQILVCCEECHDQIHRRKHSPGCAPSENLQLDWLQNEERWLTDFNALADGQYKRNAVVRAVQQEWFAEEFARSRNDYYMRKLKEIEKGVLEVYDEVTAAPDEDDDRSEATDTPKPPGSSGR